MLAISTVLPRDRDTDFISLKIEVRLKSIVHNLDDRNRLIRQNLSDEPNHKFSDLPA